MLHPSSSILRPLSHQDGSPTRGHRANISTESAQTICRDLYRSNMWTFTGHTVICHRTTTHSSQFAIMLSSPSMRITESDQNYFRAKGIIIRASNWSALWSMWVRPQSTSLQTRTAMVARTTSCRKPGDVSLTPWAHTRWWCRISPAAKPTWQCPLVGAFSIAMRITQGSSRAVHLMRTWCISREATRLSIAPVQISPASSHKIIRPTFCMVLSQLSHAILTNQIKCQAESNFLHHGSHINSLINQHLTNTNKHIRITNTLIQTAKIKIGGKNLKSKGNFVAAMCPSPPVPLHRWQRQKALKWMAATPRLPKYRVSYTQISVQLGRYWLVHSRQKRSQRSAPELPRRLFHLLKVRMKAIEHWRASATPLPLNSIKTTRTKPRKAAALSLRSLLVSSESPSRWSTS